MIKSYKEFLNLIHTFSSKPKLLIHCCCAPCSSHPLFLLKDYFDITLYFSNDNIYPESEYQLRLEELKDFMKNTKLDFNVLDSGYHPKDYYTSIKGLEHLAERSIRCYECYKLRLDKTAQAAASLGFDYFTTTLSISPYKKEEWINEIGYSLEKKYSIPYLYSNFKKEQGYLHSIELSREYNLYRQDYCGCVYSLEERRLHDESASKENENT